VIRRILVALDGSKRAEGVLRAAAEIADRFDAKLYPFRAILVPPEFPAGAVSSHADPLLARMTEEAVAAMLELTARIEGTVVDAPYVKVGQSWRMIIEASEELDVDLIVIGSHGYHGVDRILGTTAGKVANVAKRSVLVVHEREQAP
jgi:nucleotide-binding universal stress UspA family protein